MSKDAFKLQQYLPLAVLKRIRKSHKILLHLVDIAIRFTVYGIDTVDHLLLCSHQFVNITIVLTACSIETVNP